MREVTSTTFFRKNFIKLCRGENSEAKLKESRYVDGYMLHPVSDRNRQVQCMAFDYKNGQRCKHEGSTAPQDGVSMRSLRFCALHEEAFDLQTLSSSCDTVITKCNKALAYAVKAADKQKPANSSSETSAAAAAEAGAQNVAEVQNENEQIDRNSISICKIMMSRCIAARQKLGSLSMLRHLLHVDIPTYMCVTMDNLKQLIMSAHLYIEELRYQRRYTRLVSKMETVNATVSDDDAAELLRRVTSVGGEKTRVHRLKLHSHFALHNILRQVTTESGKEYNNVPSSSVTYSDESEESTLEQVIRKVMSSSTI